MNNICFYPYYDRHGVSRNTIDDGAVMARNPLWTIIYKVDEKWEAIVIYIVAFLFFLRFLNDLVGHKLLASTLVLSRPVIIIKR